MIGLSSRTEEVLRIVRAAAPNWGSALLPSRKVDSPFAGPHRTSRLGPGEDWGDARNYRSGDDVRRIDWSATARSGSVQVRDTIADRGMRITLVIDCSPSMHFGTNSLTKSDLALAVAAAVTTVANKQGDSVAAMIVRPEGLHWVGPGSGVSHTNVLLRTLSRSFTTEGPASFTEGLARAASHASSSGLFVAVSDYHDPGCDQALRRLAAQHRTIAVVVEDRRELELVPTGIIEVYDPESGEQMVLDTDSPRFVERFCELANSRRRTRDESLRASGAEVEHLECGPNWLESIERMLAGRGR